VMRERVAARATSERVGAFFSHQPPVPIQGLLFDCIRSVSDPGRVTDWTGDQTEVLELRMDSVANQPGVNLGPAEGLFLSRIDRPMTIGAMLDEAAIDRVLALRL